MDFQLIQSTYEDKPYISALRMNVLAADFKRHQLPDERVLARFNENFNPDHVYLIQLRNKTIGCIGIIVSEEEVELKNFYLDPTYQGQGIGRAVFQSVLDSYSDRKSITLKIFKGSRAKKLYEQFGFTVIDENERVETMRLLVKQPVSQL
ncbi:acetyltransferase, GNAT family [Bacillus sp. JCM 19046]|uniref:GNAT superfamily N-acetyltransferase n=1 Tax=Shouchella xiaoxiensis TaxID=766895 RepID=A0ABS2SVE0_9BACI|nr:GNAT family N-acetyltransferase [Shouchella xiaoxiensis]MBM7839508.1 GNAT superfamily N-acetyltransferase [Shouchella xiaoxiensis]GAF12357.1 acetyltransferase, GNAT family [Bacillus sp. JCM 19045]GAF19521.1 acetyltransferase, GNAT family [Bacillus sp. JCM 19046]